MSAYKEPMKGKVGGIFKQYDFLLVIGNGIHRFSFYIPTLTPTGINILLAGYVQV